MRYAQSYAAHREGLMALFGSLNRARLGLGDMPAPAAPPPNPLSDNVLARLYDTQPAQSAPSVSPELEQSLAQKATVQPLEVNTPKLKAPFFSKYGAGPNILGMMGDFLLQQSGHQPMYLNMLKFRQDADAQRVDNDYRRAATDELRRKATAPQIEKVGDSIVSVGADGAVEPLYTGQSDGERYAASLGYTPGTPGYLTAVQDYVLKSSGPTAFQTDRDLANYRHGLRLKEIGASGGEARSTAGHREGLYRSRPDVAATTPAKVIGPLVAKQANGQPLNPAEPHNLAYHN